MRSTSVAEALVWAAEVVIAFALGITMCQATDAKKGASGTIAPPAGAAFQEWLTAVRNPGHDFSDAQARARGLDLARARARELRRLMERDPERFLNLAIGAVEREQLPAELQPFIERRINARGAFRAYCVGFKPDETVDANHPASRGGYAYEVTVNGATFKAFVFGKWKDERTVQEAEIEGVMLGDAIAIGDSPTPSEQLAAGDPVISSSPTTIGPNTLLYMVARFSDQSSDPIDDATALSQVAVISNFWMNASYGAVYLKGLVNSTQAMDIVHITLPHPASSASTYNNDFAGLLSDARTAASALGFNYASYNLDVVITTASGFSYAGRSYIGAQGSHWVQGYTSLRTGGHELGHNLGLYHADYWRTDATMPFGKDSNPGGYVADSINGEWVEYGHYFSVMSAQSGSEMDDATKPIYNPAEKVQLGWLTGTQVKYVTATGTNRLFRHDARTTTGIPRAIRVETQATDYTGYQRHYWLSYRYAPWSSAQNWFRNGLEVDVAQTSYGTDGSILLDMTPYSADQSSPFYDSASPPGNWWTIDNNDKIDGALVVGRTYDDSAAGIHITPIVTGNNGANEEYIDVVINLGTFPTNSSPVISAFSASTNQAAANQTVNFSVTASDPNGDSLAYAWSFDDGQVFTSSGLNSPSANKSWPSAGQYRVTVTVSDMKGGIATESIIVTVGSPANTNQIWGRVVWGGMPVYGARVSSTVGGTVYQAWTDSDGSYVLTDLPSANSYSVTCLRDGNTFTAQFSNPVSVASGNAYGKDFYANEPLSAGGSTFMISGQITYAGNGVTGAEVRGGGMVATTDFSGNYQLSNLVNGTYSVVPLNDNWTFSPASRSVTLSSVNSTGNNFSRSAPYSISGRIDGVPAGTQSPAPTVYLSNGDSVDATKGGTGNNRFWTYTLNNVPSGKYSISAQLFNYRIAPTNFTNPLTISGNLSSINFTGISASVQGSIVGQITERGLPLQDASVVAQVGVTTVASAMTDSDGYYSLDNLAGGTYTVVPSKPGYSFSPTSLASVFAGTSDNDFTATGPNTPPVITSVTATPSVVPGVSFTSTLAAIASGSAPLSYSWDALTAAGPVAFTVNDSAVTNATVVSFQAAGSYLFRVRVTDSHSLYSTSSVSLNVSAGALALAVSPYEAQVNNGGTVTFHADGWDQLGNRITVSPTWSVSGGGSISAGGVFTASTAGGPFSVTATGSGLSATGFVWVVPSGTNHPPVPASPTLQRYATQGVKARVSSLLGSDADGDVLFLQTLATVSANGATVSTNQGWVLYVPPPGFTNDDSFNYSVGDGRGGVSPGVVTVQVKPDTNAALNVTIQRPPDGSVHLRFDGIPSRNYSVQYTEDLSNPHWMTLGNLIADGFGFFEYIDVPPNGSPTRYYRAVQL